MDNENKTAAASGKMSPRRALIASVTGYAMDSFDLLILGFIIDGLGLRLHCDMAPIGPRLLISFGYQAGQQGLTAVIMPSGLFLSPVKASAISFLQVSTSKKNLPPDIRWQIVYLIC